MQISVSGKNIDTGLAFQEHAKRSLNNVVEKYFHNAVSGQITLEKADAGFTVKTRVALSRRMELESTGRAVDAHTALVEASASPRCGAYLLLPLRGARKRPEGNRRKLAGVGTL